MVLDYSLNITYERSRCLVILIVLMGCGDSVATTQNAPHPASPGKIAELQVPKHVDPQSVTHPGKAKVVHSPKKENQQAFKKPQVPKLTQPVRVEPKTDSSTISDCPSGHKQLIYSYEPQTCNICNEESKDPLICEQCSFAACRRHTKEREICEQHEWVGAYPFIYDYNCPRCDKHKQQDGQSIMITHCDHCNLSVCVKCLGLKHDDHCAQTEDWVFVSLTNTTQLCHECGEKSRLKCSTCQLHYCQNCFSTFSRPLSAKPVEKGNSSQPDCPFHHSSFIYSYQQGSCELCGKSFKESLQCEKCLYAICRDHIKEQDFCPQHNWGEPYLFQFGYTCSKCKKQWTQQEQQGLVIADCRQCNISRCLKCLPFTHKQFCRSQDWVFTHKNQQKCHRCKQETKVKCEKCGLHLCLECFRQVCPEVEMLDPANCKTDCPFKEDNMIYSYEQGRCAVCGKVSNSTIQCQSCFHTICRDHVKQSQFCPEHVWSQPYYFSFSYQCSCCHKQKTEEGDDIKIVHCEKCNISRCVDCAIVKD